MSSSNYHENVEYRGSIYCLFHLNPFTMSVKCDGLGRDLRVRVIPLNHCFSKDKKKNEEDYIEGDPIFDQGTARERIFCLERYVQSFELEAAVRSLRGEYVLESASERNWCYVSSLEFNGKTYYVFFELKRAPRANRRMQDLELYIESAYTRDHPNVKGRVRFELLCRKTFNGEKVKTRK